MNIVLLGSPASGKGTQAELLCQKFGLYHLSTGDVARMLAKTDGRIRDLINTGKLIPAEEMSMYVVDFLKNKRPDLKNILFEGFPRYISQYEALDNFLRSKGDDIDAVISLEVPMEIAIKRISSRWWCGKCSLPYNTITNPPKSLGVCDKCGGELTQRDDDKPDAIKTRFDYYTANTKELIDYVDKKGLLTRVNGDRAIEEISRDLQEIIQNIKNEEGHSE